MLPQHRNEVLVNRRSIAVLLALAVVTVAGVAAGCGGLPGTAVAKVGDVYIDSTKFTQQVDSLATQYGLNQETDPDSYNSLAQNVLDSLVASELAVQKAPDLGISATDAEVKAKIDSVLTEYYGGDESALIADLATESLTLDDLNTQIKDFLLAGKVRDQVVKDVVAPSASEIASYYEANKADYLTTKTVEARHVLVAVGASVRSTPTTTTSTTEATESAATTTSTESTTTTTVSELTWAKALATASQLRAELLAGGSWSKLAAKYSDDPDTKNKAGNLGTLTQGSLVSTLGQEFDTSLFSLTLNQISEPLKTQYGYEIIQVTKITDPQQKPLEDAKADVAAVLLSNAQEKAWQTFIDEAMVKIGVTYREDMKPTTTTLAPTTTTLAPAATTTAGATTTTAKP
jgi:parvulin-like peptidyl-prolyl isomerase